MKRIQEDGGLPTWLVTIFAITLGLWAAFLTWGLYTIFSISEDLWGFF